jgi:hypothetical protein
MGAYRPERSALAVWVLDPRVAQDAAPPAELVEQDLGRTVGTSGLRSLPSASNSSQKLTQSRMVVVSAVSGRRTRPERSSSRGAALTGSRHQTPIGTTASALSSSQPRPCRAVAARPSISTVTPEPSRAASTSQSRPGRRSGPSAGVASTGVIANSAAPKAPCATRAVISVPMVGESPQTMLATPKPPAANARAARLPTRSSQRPDGRARTINGRR